MLTNSGCSAFLRGGKKNWNVPWTIFNMIAFKKYSWENRVFIVPSELMSTTNHVSQNIKSWAQGRKKYFWITNGWLKFSLHWKRNRFLEKLSCDILGCAASPAELFSKHHFGFRRFIHFWSQLFPSKVLLCSKGKNIFIKCISWNWSA